MAEFDVTSAKALAGVPHGFFGHGGGVHQFGYGGEGDQAVIAQQRADAADFLVPGAELAAPHQVHCPDVVAVTTAWEDTAPGRPVADAVVTASRGVALGIVTADCAPVLLADLGAGVVGAAHAGWRGANGGVLDNTLDAMEALGAERSDIRAAIGPTIAQASYEVDAPFRENFTADDDRHFSVGQAVNGSERWQFDLPGYVAAQLARNGVKSVEIADLDTFSLSERYYSYRRATKLGEANYGRQISMIALPRD